MLLFSAGLVCGLALGAGFLKFRKSDAPSLAAVSPAEAETVTFAGAAPSGEASGALAALLEARDTTGLQRSRETLAFVDSVAASDFAARLDEIFAQRKGSKGADLISGIYERWVKLDAAAALRHAENLEGKDRKAALSSVLSHWAKEEPRKVLAWIEANGGNEGLQSPVSAALRQIGRKNPLEAIELLESNPLLRGGGRSFGSDGKVYNWSPVDPGFLYQIWAETDPAAAAARAVEITDNNQRYSSITSVAREWATRDPAAAWRWAGTLTRPNEQENISESIIATVMADGDTRQAVAFLETMPDGKPRTAALGKIALTLAMSDPAGALDFLRKNVRTSGDEEAYSGVLSHWSRTDPDRAIETALAMESGKVRSASLVSIIHEVANRDAAAAFKMLERIDPEEWQDMSYSIAYHLAQKDPKGAFAWAQSIPDEETRSNALSNVLNSWAQRDPVQACEQVKLITDPKSRDRALQSALSNWSYQDAVSAMTWAIRNLDEKQQLNIIPNSLISSWTKQDRAGVQEWISALPEGDLRSATTASFVDRWANEDVVAAGTWLRGLKGGESRDRAVISFSGRVFRTDPEAALIWAASIRDGERRTSQVENLAVRYLNENPAAAKRWITNSPLPPEKKAELLKRADGN